jgi:flagellar motor protein MotB
MRCIIGLFRYKFLVVGHTSSTGKAKHNLELSQKRADAINEALSTTLAVSPDRPFSIGAAEGRRSTLARPRQPTTVVFD